MRFPVEQGFSRRQRGSTGGGCVSVLVLGIVAAIAVNALAQSGMVGKTGSYVAGAIAAGLVLWFARAAGALTFMDTVSRATLAERMGRQFGAKVASRDVPIWGGSTDTAYVVEWDGPRCRLTLELGPTGTSLSADAPESPASGYEVAVSEGKFTVKGEGAAAERLLDEGTRAALNTIDRLKGGKGDLWLHCSNRRVWISKQEQLTESATRELVALATPVLERALALMNDGERQQGKQP